MEDKVLDEHESLALFTLLSEYCERFEEKEADAETKKRAHQLKVQATQVREKGKTKLQYNSNYEFLDSLIPGNEYFMSYKDASGNASDRHIVLNKVDDDGVETYYLKARCLLRNGQRTFRVDRIDSLCDAETGEAFV